MNEQLGRKGEVQTSKGTLRYYDRGEGPPIVFLHGLATNPLIWRNVVSELAGSFRCICLELPLGSHEVPMSSDADLSLVGLGDLVEETLETLGLADVTVVGSDSGGAIAQLVAANHPDRVARLVLTPCDAFEHVPPPRYRYLKVVAFLPGMPWFLAQGMRANWMRRLPIAYGPLTKRPIPREITDQWVGPIRRFDIRRDGMKYVRGARKQDTLEAALRLRHFDKPTLIVWSREDPIFPFEDAERLAKLIPNARLVEVEDSYGFVSEDQPKRLASEIAAFLAGTGTSGEQSPAR
jgi:pimeloyl-ACP methyl ester carboxylesterase